MTPEDAYGILEAIAQIHGCEDKLKRIKPSLSEEEEEDMAEEIEAEHKERLSPFKFSMCGIESGAILVYWNSMNDNTGITCVVVDDKQVEYDNKLWSLSALAKVLSKSKYSVAGPRYFKYNGQWLNDIREKKEREN